MVLSVMKAKVRLIHFLTVIFLTLLSSNVKATHVMGSDISWEQLNKDSIKIVFKL